MTTASVTPESPPWERLSADLAAAMRPGLPATVRAVASAVTAAIPADPGGTATPADTGAAGGAHAGAAVGADGGKLARDVRTAVQVALGHFLDLAGTDQPALPPRVREVFVALGAAEAREERGPEALLAAYRTASRLLLRLACDALAALRPVGTGELLDLADAVTAYVDELAAASTDGFTRQLRAQAGEDDRRRHFAELLLRGGAPASVAEVAAAGVGWRSLGLVVPVVLPREQAREVRFRYAADGVVAERAGDVVLLLPVGPRAGRAELTAALAGRGAVVGPALGWAEVPESVRLAELAGDLAGRSARGWVGMPAERPAERSAGEPVGHPDLGHPDLGHPDLGGAGPVFADDHLGALALRGEPAALAVLAVRRLAPLGSLRPGQREVLLATLHSWLKHWGSRAEVSAELFVHPQTVSYRLRRLRELLGADLDHPTARFELQLVLAAGQTSA